jgi:hypothetical protein
VTEPQDFEKLADELRKEMNELLQEAVREPMTAAIAQIPNLLQRQDWPMETRVTAVRTLQVAISSPFLNAAVNSAHASGMDLGTFLNYVGSAWEEIRSQHMARMAADMLNPKEPGA